MKVSLKQNLTQSFVALFCVVSLFACNHSEQNGTSSGNPEPQSSESQNSGTTQNSNNSDEASKKKSQDPDKDEIKKSWSITQLETDCKHAGVSFEGGSSAAIHLDPTQKAADQIAAAQRLADRIALELPGLQSAGDPSAKVMEERAIALKELIQDLNGSASNPGQANLKVYKHADYSADKTAFKSKWTSALILSHNILVEETAAGRVLMWDKKKIKEDIKRNIHGKAVLAIMKNKSLSEAEKADAKAKIKSGILPDTAEMQSLLDESIKRYTDKNVELNKFIQDYLAKYGELSFYAEYPAPESSSYLVKSKHLNVAPGALEIATPVGAAKVAPAKSVQEEMSDLKQVKYKLFDEMTAYISTISTIPAINDPNT